MSDVAIIPRTAALRGARATDPGTGRTGTVSHVTDHGRAVLYCDGGLVACPRLAALSLDPKTLPGRTQTGGNHG